MIRCQRIGPMAARRKAEPKVGTKEHALKIAKICREREMELPSNYHLLSTEDAELLVDRPWLWPRSMLPETEN